MARKSRYCPPSALPTPSEPDEPKGYSLSQIDANGMAAKYDENGRFIGYVFYGLEE